MERLLLLLLVLVLEPGREEGGEYGEQAFIALSAAQCFVAFFMHSSSVIDRDT